MVIRRRGHFGIALYLLYIFYFYTFDMDFGYLYAHSPEERNIDRDDDRVYYSNNMWKWKVVRNGQERFPTFMSCGRSGLRNPG